MTVMEKFATNFMTIIIARVAMIATPIVMGWFMVMAVNAWERIDNRFSVLETEQAKQHDQLNDLNYRAVTGKAAREALTTESKMQFAALSEKLDKLSGSVIRIETIIETRLPVRSGELEQRP